MTDNSITSFSCYEYGLRCEEVICLLEQMKALALSKETQVFIATNPGFVQNEVLLANRNPMKVRSASAVEAAKNSLFGTLISRYF